MTRNQTSSACVLLVAAVTAVGVAGCSVPKAADFKPSKLFFWNDDEPEKGVPVRMVGTWTDTVMSTPGQKSQRGFGGRLHFYGKDEEKPIVVDGQLVVYAFDETNRAPTDNKPTRRYVFPADQMPLRMSISEIGASYSFFLPWDEAGGPQTEVSLICRFEPVGGAVIASEQTKHILPGAIAPTGTATAGKPPTLPEGVPHRPAQPTLESVQQGRTVDQNVQQAAYLSPVAGGDVAADFAAAQPMESTERLTTTSIPLPQNFRLPMGPPNAQQSAAAVPPTSLPMQRSQQMPATSVQQLPAAAPASTDAQSVPAAAASQQTRLGFGAYPSTQSLAPTVLMPTTYSPATRGFAAPPAQLTAPMQPTPAQVGRLTNSRSVQWNTVQTTTLPAGGGSKHQMPAATTQPGMLPTQPQTAGLPTQQQPLLTAAGTTAPASFPPVANYR